MNPAKTPAAGLGKTSLIKRDWCFPSAKPSTCHGALVLDPPPDIPDLAIYSQDEIIARGEIPSFKNDDIQFWLYPAVQNNQYVFPVPAHAPTVKVTARNISAKASAVNAMVDLYWSPPGIGLPRVLLSTQAVTIPAGQTVQLDFPVPDAILGPQPGGELIGFFVDLRIPHDKNLINNRGASNVSYIISDVVDLHLPLTVRNESSQRRDLVVGVPEAPGEIVVMPAGPQSFDPEEQKMFDVHQIAQAGVAFASLFQVLAKDAAGTIVGGMAFETFFNA